MNIKAPNEETNTTIGETKPEISKGFRGDVFRIATGTTIAQLIGILAAPVLTRIYSPEIFGMAAIFNSIASILGVIVCMRYELSIVLPTDEHEATNLLALSLLCAAIFACATIPLIWFGVPYIVGWIKFPELNSYLWLIPFSLLMQGSYLALNYWHIRIKAFSPLSAARVISQLLTTSTMLGAGFLGCATAGAMIGASISGQIISVVVLGKGFWQKKRGSLSRIVHWREIKKGLIRYRDFPIFSSWSAMLNSASWQLPVLMLGLFFSPEVAGYYALGFRVLHIPMSLIGGAVGQVFFQRAVKAKSDGSLSNLVEALFQRLLMLALLPGLILVFIGEDIFRAVFGENWVEAGTYVQLLSPWAIVWFISSPLSSIYTVLEKQNREFFIQGLILFTRLAAIGVGGYTGSKSLTIFLFSLAGLLSYSVLIRIIFGFCGINMIEALRRIVLKNMGLIGLFLIPVLVCKIIEVKGFALLIISGISVVCYYYSIRKNF